MHGLVGGLTKKAAFQKDGYSTSALSNPDSVLNCPRFVRYLDAQSPGRAVGVVGEPSGFSGTLIGRAADGGQVLSTSVVRSPKAYGRLEEDPRRPPRGIEVVVGTDLLEHHCLARTPSRSRLDPMPGTFCAGHCSREERVPRQAEKPATAPIQISPAWMLIAA